jgi:hypothetical protein
MTQEKEPVTIGLSESGHQKLKRLKADGHFNEMVDGYRFAIALALAHGGVAPAVGSGKSTFVNVGTLDPDKSIYVAVATLRDAEEEPVYRTAERLAEWGVEELSRRADDGRFSVLEILEEAAGLLEKPEARLNSSERDS